MSSEIEKDKKLTEIGRILTHEENSNPEYQQFLNDWEVTIADGLDELE